MAESFGHNYSDGSSAKKIEKSSQQVRVLEREAPETQASQPQPEAKVVFPSLKKQERETLVSGVKNYRNKSINIAEVQSQDEYEMGQRRRRLQEPVEQTAQNEPIPFDEVAPEYVSGADQLKNLGGKAVEYAMYRFQDRNNERPDVEKRAAKERQLKQQARGAAGQIARESLNRAWGKNADGSKNTVEIPRVENVDNKTKVKSVENQTPSREQTRVRADQKANQRESRRESSQASRQVSQRAEAGVETVANPTPTATIRVETGAGQSSGITAEQVRTARAEQILDTLLARRGLTSADINKMSLKDIRALSKDIDSPEFQSMSPRERARLKMQIDRAAYEVRMGQKSFGEKVTQGMRLKTLQMRKMLRKLGWLVPMNWVSKSFRSGGERLQAATSELKYQMTETNPAEMLLPAIQDLVKRYGGELSLDEVQRIKNGDFPGFTGLASLDTYSGRGGARRYNRGAFA